jgi:hypothetical protein
VVTADQDHASIPVTPIEGVMHTRFRLATSDPEEFQARIAPISGECQVRQIRGSRFSIGVRAFHLGRISLFVVRSPSLRVEIDPPHSYLGLNVPLGRAFYVVSRTRGTSGFLADFHLLHPDQRMKPQGDSEISVLAVKLDWHAFRDYAFRLSGSRETVRTPATD